MVFVHVEPNKLPISIQFTMKSEKQFRTTTEALINMFLTLSCHGHSSLIIREFMETRPRKGVIKRPGSDRSWDWTEPRRGFITLRAGRGVRRPRGNRKDARPPAQATSLTGPASSIPEASSGGWRGRNLLSSRRAPLATAGASTLPLQTPRVPTPWLTVQPAPRLGHGAGARGGAFGAELSPRPACGAWLRLRKPAAWSQGPWCQEDCELSSSRERFWMFLRVHSSTLCPLS